MATVVSDTSPTANRTVWLVNAAFLQEMKDSNPHLWHQFHHLRILCQLEPEDCESPQATIKAFARCLDELRDLLALQFSLEESYGLIASPSDDGSGLLNEAVSPAGKFASSPSSLARPYAENSLEDSFEERQMMIESVISDHRSLYLRIVDYVEQAEELQYRGCDSSCLRSFAEKIERYCLDFTAHERLEGELIRLHGGHSAMPSQSVAESDMGNMEQFLVRQRNGATRNVR